MECKAQPSHATHNQCFPAHGSGWPPQTSAELCTEREETDTEATCWMIPVSETSREGKTTKKADSGSRGCQGWGMTANGHEVLWGGGNVLKLDSGGGCAILQAY